MGMKVEARESLGSTDSSMDATRNVGCVDVGVIVQGSLHPMQAEYGGDGVVLRQM